MFYFNRFDEKRHIGIIENKAGQYMVVPPHDMESVRPIAHRFVFESHISRAPSIDRIVSEVKCESNIITLSTLANIWSKQKSGTGKTITISESAAQVLRQIINGLEQGQLLPSDLTDLMAIARGIGITEDAGKKILRGCKTLDLDGEHKNTEGTIQYILAQTKSQWNSEIEPIIDYIKRVVVPGLRVQEAKGSLVAINGLIAQGSLEVTSGQRLLIDECYTLVQSASAYKAAQNNESLAKPWQAYAPTNVGFKYKNKTRLKPEDTTPKPDKPENKDQQ